MADRASAVLSGRLCCTMRAACYQVWMSADTKSRIIASRFFADDEVDSQVGSHDLNGRIRRLLLRVDSYHSIQSAARNLALVFWSKDQLRSHVLPRLSSEKPLPSSRSSASGRRHSRSKPLVSRSLSFQADQTTSAAAGDAAGEAGGKSKENALPHWRHYYAFWISVLAYEGKAALLRQLDHVLTYAVGSMRKRLITCD